jgi:hypothetical protein
MADALSVEDETVHIRLDLGKGRSDSLALPEAEESRYVGKMAVRDGGTGFNDFHLSACHDDHDGHDHGVGRGTGHIDTGDKAGARR